MHVVVFRLVSSFPFVSYMGILYEVGEILGIIRDMILLNPKENLSVKEYVIYMLMVVSMLVIVYVVFDACILFV